MQAPRRATTLRSLVLRDVHVKPGPVAHIIVVFRGADIHPLPRVFLLAKPQRDGLPQTNGLTAASTAVRSPGEDQSFSLKPIKHIVSKTYLTTHTKCFFDSNPWPVAQDFLCFGTTSISDTASIFDTTTT
jgi:hypothetical protein